MVNIISKEAMQRARKKKQAKDAIISFFSRVPHINKECPFVVAKLDNCQVYIPVSNLEPSKVHILVPELENVYSIFTNKK